MKKAMLVFAALAILLACAMCATVAYCYRGMLCAIEHNGTSAPASVAFLWILPFGVAIAACAVCATVFYRKLRKGDHKWEK